MTNYTKRSPMITACLAVKEKHGMDMAKWLVSLHAPPGGKLVDVPEEKWEALRLDALALMELAP